MKLADILDKFKQSFSSPLLPEHERRRANLLSVLLLSLILLVPFAYLVAFFTNPEQNPFSSEGIPIAVGAIFCLGASLLINRRSYFLAARLAVIVSALGAWAAVFVSSQGEAVDPFILAFVLVSIVLSGILLTALDTTLLGLAHSVALGLLFPGSTNALTLIGFLSVIVVVSSLITRADFNQIIGQNKKIENTEKRFRSLVENSTDAIVLLNPQGEILYQSPAATKILGYPSDELLNTSVFGLIHSEDLASVTKKLEKLLEDRQLQTRIQFRARHANGSWRWIELAGQNLLNDPDIGAIVGNYFDITEGKEARERIDRQIKQLSALRDIDNVIISSFDLKTNLSAVLSSVSAQLGVDASDVLIFNQAFHQLEYAYGRGFLTSERAGKQIRLGEGVTGLAALERRVVRISDLSEQASEGFGPEFIAREKFISYICVPLIAKGELRGVLEIFQRSTINDDPEWFDFLNALAGQAAIALDNVNLFKVLQRSNVDLSLAYDATIEGWSRALDLRDKETEGHTQRVTKLTVELARVFGLGENELAQVRWGALLHDIGKMGVPDSILFKPGPLTDEEWIGMKKHPVTAYEMLKPIHYLQGALDIPYAHHERWDGSGYPRGLRGESIPIAARLFAVVDVYDALCSERPYRGSWGKTKTMDYLREEKGKLFDPKIVDVFLKMTDNF